MSKDGGAACKYERLQGSRPSANSPPRDSLKNVPRPLQPDSSDSGSSYSPSLDPRERSLTPPKKPERQPSPPVLEKSTLVPSTDVSVLVVGGTKRSSHPISSAFTVLPSINLQTIHRPLHIPLSLVSPEHTQVSFAAGSDLDMSL